MRRDDHSMTAHLRVEEESDELLGGMEGEDLLPEIIRSEVNLLVLPFFALSRKGLKQKIKTEYRTTVVRGGRRLEILWQVTANAEYGYPGPFDKQVHKAVEQIISELPLPLKNPIRLGSLYRLAKSMGLKPSKNGNYSGWVYRQIKEALERIVLVGIRSRGTFYSKEKKKWIDEVFHLYDRVIFKGEQLPDGRIADTNYLYLSSWYLENLNALYVKPLDYGYYRSLKSTVSQRLYELLGVKFYRLLQEGIPSLRYRYSTLCQLLPITRQRFLSKAKEKLEPAHRELKETGFLERVMWRESPREGDDWFLYYFPGPRAREEVERLRLPEDVLAGEGDLELGLESLPAGRAKGGRSEEWEIEALVQEMLRVLEDERSKAFYRKVAKTVPADLIYRCLSEVKEEWHEGLIRTTKGAVFTDKLKRYCRERGIELGLRGSGSQNQN